MKKVILFFVVIAFPFLVADCFFNQSYSAEKSAIVIANAFAYPTLKGTTTGAAYADITNKSAASIRLVKAESEIAARTEIHEMSMDGGVMKMRAVERLELAPGETVALTPGGLHVMFFDMKRPLELGESFTLTLYDDKGAATTATAKVEDRDF